MSYAQLTVMEQRIARAKAGKQDAERAELRKKVTDFVKSQEGFHIRDLFGGRAKVRGAVAAKYRVADPNSNTWTGRGRDAAGWPRQPKAARQKRKTS